MPVTRLEEVQPESFPGGASYQTIVGDDLGSTPVCWGIQISPPGGSTGTHSHPYMEIITVLEGTGEAWIDGEWGNTPIGPGNTLILAANTKHGFRATGLKPLKTYGVHTSPARIV